ncbi:MAG: TetR/AcrR family transcriptional regulator [Deltaproteobacteria bacterium]|nr:TetR/AcrR family transcriptional regulator [Deltaproteobacteria bacterium]
MSRKQAGVNKEKSRKKILDAATALFGRRGYSATTVESVTRAAGLSRGSLYWHFKSKSDLLGAVVERLEKEYLDKLSQEVAAAGPRAIDQLWHVFKFNARFAVDNTELIHCLRALSLELSPSEDLQAKSFNRLLERQQGLLVRLIQEAQAQGDARTDLKADLLALVILGVHDGVLLQWARRREAVDGRELAWTFRQVTLAGLDPGAPIIKPGPKPQRTG